MPSCVLACTDRPARPRFQESKIKNQAGFDTGFGRELRLIFHASHTWCLALMYLTLKFVHVSCAVLTIAGFLLRGYWMMSGSAWLQHRLTKTAPHVIDTLFLVAGIALVFQMHIQVMQHSWLLAKFAGLIAYIVLGLFALRLGRTPLAKTIAFVAAVSTYAYITGVALTKSVVSWMAYVAV